MKQRPLLTFASLLIVILIGFAVTQVAQAASYFWRWVPPVSTVTCTMSSGTIDVHYDNLTSEWNLPVGAMIGIYHYANGSLLYYYTTSYFASPSGSLTFAGDDNITAGYPLTYVVRYDTIVDGQTVYRSTFTVNCAGDGAGTMTITNEDLTATCIALPDGSVVGDLPFQTQAFYAPGKISPDVFINPGTYWVIGEDASGQYYEILLSCQYLWVPIDSMQPSYQSPWTGQPLPTRVVS